MKAEFLKNHSYFLEVFNGIEHLFKTESEYPYFKNLWNKTDNFKLEELFGFKRFLAASLVLLCIQKKIVIYREVKDFLGFLANQNNLPVEIIDIYVDFYLKNEILFRVRKVTRYESLEDDELTFFISSDMKEDFFREMREMPHRYEEGFFLVNRWFVKNFFEFKKLLKKSKEMIDKNDSFSKSLKLNGYLKIKIPKKAFSLFAIYVKYLIKLDIKDDTVENLYDLMCRTVQLALITAVNYQLIDILPSLKEGDSYCA